MSASVLATGRAFSSQSAGEISDRAGCRQAARARARPDLRIQIVHALSQLDSCTSVWVGVRACDGMEVDRQAAAGCSLGLRNLLRANSSARTS